VQPEELAKTIDHTLLRPDSTVGDVMRLCDEAAAYHFASVCVHPWFVPLAAERLRRADVKAGTVVSFPFGADSPRVKVMAASDAIACGADEIDVVIALPAMLSGEFTAVRNELASIVRAAHVQGVNHGRGQVIVKAIIETCYLSDQLKRLACRICEQANVDFVKTSTGFGPHGATVRDVELLRECLDERIAVKASGGIRTVRDVERMVNAGAVRVGTSAGVDIMRHYAD